MTSVPGPIAPVFLRDLEYQAQRAARIEADYRLESRDRVAQLEAARVAAYRRLNLLSGMAGAMAGVAEEGPAIEAGLDHVCARTGWTDADSSFAELRERLRPTAAAISTAGRPLPSEQPPPSSQAPLLAFASFEAWYRGRFNTDFLSLMASDAPTFQSVVDF
ncbi:MAG TPA: hypothetical protein VJ890_23685 [Vineibacter sp.]|nr:hypothetical protein [Vineibacter sp.]